jgi:hypothetical protein
MARIIPSRSPNLPLAPNQYAPLYHEQMNNALRLYFNRKDLNETALLGPLGTQFLNNAHISASDTTDQFAVGNNIPTLIRLNTIETNAGFVLDPLGIAVVPVSGTYKIDYSLQVTNTDNAAHDIFVWLQVNGNNLPRSSSRFTVPQRKSSSEFGHIVAYSSIAFEIAGADEVRLFWATDLAATSGGGAGLFLDDIPGQTTPYVRPGTPSAIGSIVMISCPCEV